MTTHSLGTLVLVAVIAVLSPPLADLAGRKAPVPLVVFEIVLGILVGLGVLLAPTAKSEVIVGIALSTTALGTLGLVPLFLGLFLLTRGVPSFLTAPDGVSARGRRAIALYAATGLPLIVAITAIGVERGTLKASTAAAMVGAGMLSVLLYPFLTLKVSRDTRAPRGRQEAAESW